MCNWDVEPSAYGDGYWFVRVSQAIISAILPPGARLRRHDRRHGIDDGGGGWRTALWRSRQAGHRPVIDLDPPDEVREIDTRTVLELLAPELHELVWQTLQAQLRHARAHGGAARGHARPEDAARAGALAVRWLEDEMRSAFPDRAWQLAAVEQPDAWALPCAVPDTPADLLALIPHTAHAAAAPLRPAAETARSELDAVVPRQPVVMGSTGLLLVLITNFPGCIDPHDDALAAARGSVDFG